MLAEAGGIVLGATEGFTSSDALVHTGEDALGPGGPAWASRGDGGAWGFTGGRLRSRFDSGLSGGRASGDVNWGTELLREVSALRGM